MTTHFQVAVWSALCLIESGRKEHEAIAIVIRNHHWLKEAQVKALRHRVSAELFATDQLTAERSADNQTR